MYCTVLLYTSIMTYYNVFKQSDVIMTIKRETICHRKTDQAAFESISSFFSVCVCALWRIMLCTTTWLWLSDGWDVMVQCKNVFVRNNLHSLKDWQDSISCSHDSWNVNEHLSIVMIWKHQKLLACQACRSTFCSNDCFSWNRHHHYYTNNITGLMVLCTKFACRNEAVKFLR